MPHQCLNCGRILPSGSPEILKGCGQCGGRKFLFTSADLTEAEREHIRMKTNDDIKTLFHQMVYKHDPSGKVMERVEKVRDTTGWLHYTPSGDSKGPEAYSAGVPETEEGKFPSEIETQTKSIYGKWPQVVTGNGIPEPSTPTPAPMEAPKKPPTPVKPKVRKADLKKPPAQRRRAEDVVEMLDPLFSPEFIKVVEPGVYEIDLEGLLNASTVIVQQDGTYLLHLGNIFAKYKKQ